MSGLVLLTVLFLAPLFTNLPQAILGAIVISSVMGLLDVKELRRYRAVRRIDFWLALLALFGVLLTDVLTGLAIAVIMSLLMVLYRASRPSIVVVGRVPGEPGAYSDIARNPDNEQIPGLIIFRMDAPLYFFNSNVAHTQISGRIDATDPPPKAILLDIGATNDLDVASLDTVGEMVEDFRRRGLEVGLVHVRGGVRDRLRKTPAMDTIGADHIFMSIEAGVQADLRHFAAPASSENAGTESHE
jgi:MFS superfamily sulfate permease-like transporter